VSVDKVVVRTCVYETPERVYEFLIDFPRYANYSKYLDAVNQTTGDGGPGTEYALVFSWWKIEYMARFQLTGMDAPTQIDWRVIKDISAAGYWGIESVTDRSEITGNLNPDLDAEAVCEVTFEIQFDPSSASSDALDLPRFVSMDYVVDKVISLIQREATRVVERAVADLEGASREVELHVTAESE
jgi:Polyketide cyclase / dehydrase and lipid transport.